MTPDLYHRGQNVKWSPDPGSDVLGIDWFSATLPDAFTGELQERVRAAELGPATSQRGRHGFAVEARYPSGASVSWGHKSERCMLNVPGGACSSLGSAWLVETAAQLLELGGEDVRFTRVDIRRDVMQPGQTLIDDIIRSCEGRELRRVRGFKKFVERDAERLELIGHGVYLGSSKSPRFVRCYDKGLETKLLPPGWWLRFEAQLREEFADQAVRSFCLAGESWHLPAFQVLAGVVDFAGGQRGSGANWDASDRPRFWSEFLAGHSVIRGDCKKRHPDLVSHLCWLAQSLGQLQAACDALGVGLGVGVERLVGRATIPQERKLVPHLVSALLERSSVISSTHDEEEDSGEGQAQAVPARRS